jgi:hypothetical protein
MENYSLHFILLCYFRLLRDALSTVTVPLFKKFIHSVYFIISVYILWMANVQEMVSSYVKV